MLELLEPHAPEFEEGFHCTCAVQLLPPVLAVENVVNLVHVGVREGVFSREEAFEVVNHPIQSHQVLFHTRLCVSDVF